MSQTDNLHSGVMPGLQLEDSPLQADLADELFMQRLEMDVLRQQMVGLPVERMIEGFVPAESMEIHMARYRFAAERLSGRLLDMACGPGYGSSLLAEWESSNSVLGVDIDPATVRYAALRYRHERVRFECQDACIPWTSQKFDGIASFETIEHVSEPDTMLLNIVDMLKPDGCLIVSTPVRRSGKLTDKPDWPFHKREWSIEEFHQLLTECFDHVAVYGQQWRVRQDYGFIHLGKRLSRRLAGLSGIDDATHQRLRFEVMDSKLLPKLCLGSTPFYTVCVCHGPHLPTDSERLRRLAYGE